MVELPSYPSAPPDPRRRISPAVGEAAKKFAPNLALGAKESSAVAPEPEPLPLEPLGDSEPGMQPLPAMNLTEPPSLTNLPPEAASPPAAEPARSEPAALPAKDNRDVYAESATMQVEPLSSESLAPAAPALAQAAPVAAAQVAAAPVAAAPADAPAPAAPAASPAAPEMLAPAARALDLTAPEAMAPALAPAAAELPAAPTAAAAADSAAPSPWDESTDPLAAAPSPAQVTSPGHPLPGADEPLSHDAPTAPGHRIDIPAESAAPEAAPAVAAEPAPARDTVETASVSAPAPASAPAAEAAPASSDEAIETAPLPPLAEAPAPLPEPREVAAAAITAESAPLKLPAPSARSAEDDEFDAEMRAALGKNKRRWPLYLGLAAVAAIALAFYFWPQPPTDKKDSRWLESQAAQPAQPAPAAVPATPVAPAPVVTPDAGAQQQASAADAGPAVDAGAIAAVPAPAPAPAAAAPVDAGPEVAAPPVNDDYARALATGESLLKRGKYNAAVAELTKAVKINPEAVPALLELGDAWLESDKPRSALKPLEKAIKLDPRSSRAQLLYGTALQSLGKNADAVKAYQRYLEMESGGRVRARCPLDPRQSAEVAGMHFIGIETSCDETAAAVIAWDARASRASVLSDVVHTQAELHARYGGVVPELASRDHLQRALPVVDEALARAGLELAQLDGIAGHARPGPGRRAAGRRPARARAGAGRGQTSCRRQPSLGHLLAVLLGERHRRFLLGAGGLRGSHQPLRSARARRGGRARPHARRRGRRGVRQGGQAARPALSRRRAHRPAGARGGDRARTTSRVGSRAAAAPVDFSFSGLKTSLLVHVQAHGVPGSRRSPISAPATKRRSRRAHRPRRPRRRAARLQAVALCGGVAANSRLRALALERSRAAGLELFLPAPRLCTDNGAMIAVAGAPPGPRRATRGCSPTRGSACVARAPRNSCAVTTCARRRTGARTSSATSASSPRWPRSPG